ncbi:MAG: hypothetical protein UT50_C0006G0014 [Candidatus Moranbacteria bacterium GW2011_GWA2_39_41]|nr:MAG: hypothetical protein UT50_C0006G0014 [Candidatus Moranbacteria bacterium GW2011_GWA2_39_41]
MKYPEYSGLAKPNFTGQTNMAEENKGGNDGGVKWILIIVIVVIIAVVGYWFFKKPASGAVVDASKYQAVFLTNGQTYFGKVSGEKNAYVSLDEVYYMVLKRPLQSQNKEGEDQNQDQARLEYTLIKLGKEMHGPISMSISKEQILFIENLADDSKVVSTIKNKK